jgi:hypothetical protein
MQLLSQYRSGIGARLEHLRKGAFFINSTVLAVLINKKAIY